MKGKTGDRIVVVPTQVGGKVRDGRIVEVRGDDGDPPYVVEWSDGHRGLYFPGPDGFVEHAEHEPPHAEPLHVKTWQVEIHLFEKGDKTSAHAVLRAESPTKIEASGEAHRNPTDFDVPEIGDEVAVARALRHLSDQLLDTAATDIGEIEERPVHLHM